MCLRELDRRMGERRRQRLELALLQLEADRRQHQRRFNYDNARIAHWMQRFDTARRAQPWGHNG